MHFREVSYSWVEDGLEAARIKAELLTVLPNPGMLVTNIDSKAPPLRTDSVGVPGIGSPNLYL